MIQLIGVNDLAPQATHGVPLHKRVPTLAWMQEKVGGYIERVSVLYNNGRAELIVNEEGAIKNLPLNRAATEIYRNYPRTRGMDLSDVLIFGPAILLTGENTMEANEDRD